ncbi:hypothetical protein SDC9_103458 [bioreactor metagenome]|uniref:Uncharacterized protein n=2 Tax=root TaxID=1 RepID=A0ABS4JXN6_9CLOT|nr:hypothetical protein [Clostridium punense]
MVFELPTISMAFGDLLSEVFYDGKGKKTRNNG